MNDIQVTLVGRVIADPTYVRLDARIHVLSLRVAPMSRRYDRRLGRWRDASAPCVAVACWRGLAENVAASVRNGDFVVVTGNLRMRNYPGKDGDRGFSVEVEATTVGHDLSRGVVRAKQAAGTDTAAARPAA